MGLPYLQASKRPRVARPGEDKLPEEKIINGSDDDMLNDQVASELLSAIKVDDRSQLMSALEVIVRNIVNKMNEPQSPQE